MLQLKPVQLLGGRFLFGRGHPAFFAGLVRGQMGVKNEALVVVAVLLMHMEERSFR